MDQSGDDMCQLLPRGISRRLKFDVDQSVIDTCHMCHVTVRSSPVGPSPGVVGTHPPSTIHHPPPTRVFLGSSPGVRKFHGCFGKFPGAFGEVPGVFGKFPGCFWKFRVFLGSSPGVLGIPRAGTGVLLCQKQNSQFQADVPC